MLSTNACWSWNHLPNEDTGLSPYELWTKSQFPLRNFHSLLFLFKVLENQLVDGKKKGQCI